MLFRYAVNKWLVVRVLFVKLLLSIFPYPSAAVSMFNTQKGTLNVYPGL